MRAGNSIFIGSFAHGSGFRFAGDKTTDARQHFAVGKRLGYECINAKLIGIGAILLLSFCGEHQDSDVTQSGVFFNLLEDFETIFVGQHQVKNNDIRLMFPSEVDRIIAIVNFKNVVSFLIQDEAEGFNDINFVFNDEY